MFAITVTLMATGVASYLLSITTMQNKKYGLSALTGSLAVALVITAGIVGARSDSAEDAKRESVLEATYQVKVIKESSGGFIATDKLTGKTLDCKVTKDDSIVVCDGAVRQPQK